MKDYGKQSHMTPRKIWFMAVYWSPILFWPFMICVWEWRGYHWIKKVSRKRERKKVLSRIPHTYGEYVSLQYLCFWTIILWVKIRVKNFLKIINSIKYDSKIPHTIPWRQNRFISSQWILHKGSIQYTMKLEQWEKLDTNHNNAALNFHRYLFTRHLCTFWCFKLKKIILKKSGRYLCGLTFLSN